MVAHLCDNEGCDRNLTCRNLAHWVHKVQKVAQNMHCQNSGEEGQTVFYIQLPSSSSLKNHTTDRKGFPDLCPRYLCKKHQGALRVLECYLKFRTKMVLLTDFKSKDCIKHEGLTTLLA